MQQFRIESEKIRDKLNQLLPSQANGAIGVDLSGSTQIIPIVDLTEIAEGGVARADLQTAMSLTSNTAFNVVNTTTTLINTTGYFRVFAVIVTGSNDPARFTLTDGTTTKVIADFGYPSGTGLLNYTLDFVIFVKAGESLTATSGGTSQILSGSTRQLADLSGNLVNPL